MAGPIYAALCRRDGVAWAVSVPAFGETLHVARLADVARAVLALVAARAPGERPSAEVRVDLLVSERARSALDRIAPVRLAADSLSVSAIRVRREIARCLAAEDFPVRDIADALGVSFGRAQQLIGNAGRSAGSLHSVRRNFLRRRSAIRGRGPARAAEPGSGRRRVPAPARPAAGPPVPAHRSYRHEAVLYRGEAEFLAVIVPFLLDAVNAGQPALVALVEPRLSRVREALGRDADAVRFVDMAEIGSNPARILPAWRQFLTEHSAAGPVRGVGEPLWPGRPSAEVSECQLHEALLNVAIDPDAPFWLWCPYDAGQLNAATIQAAECSHPTLVDDAGLRGSTTYGGAYLVTELFTDRLPPPAATVEAFGLADRTLGQVRALVAARAAQARVGEDRVLDLTLAVSEVITNSLRYASGRGTLRLWREDAALVCEVSDPGVIADPLVGRRTPSPAAEGGRGLWLVNQLCDLVQIRSDPRGTTVRLSTWLAA